MSSVSFPGVHVSTGADWHRMRWHKPWGGEASPAFLDTASLASVFVVTAPGEELYSLFPAAQTEIESVRTKQTSL